MAPTKLTAEEVIVFDSSTFIEEAGLTSQGASALKHYLRHRGTHLVVPEAAVEEYERNLVKKVMGRIKRIEDDLKWLGRVCGKVDGWSAPTKKEITQRANSLARATHLKAVVVRETETIRARATERNRAEQPPSHRRPSLADCKIWEQCLELLEDHDVVFVARDGDFRSGRNPKDDKLHPQLQAEADQSAGKGRKLTFHTKIETLLKDLEHEVPSIADEKVFRFVYEAIAEDVQELETNCGYRPNKDGKVAQIYLTTSDADIIEVRIVVDDKWTNSEDGSIATFRLRGSCHYSLSDRQLNGLNVSEIGLFHPESDGVLRPIAGSHVRVHTGIAYVGVAPIQPKPEILGQRP